MKCPFLISSLQPVTKREEKSLRHVAMVAKFLDDKRSKRHLKSGFALFQTSSILSKFILSVKSWRNFLG